MDGNAVCEVRILYCQGDKINTFKNAINCILDYYDDFSLLFGNKHFFNIFVPNELKVRIFKS